MRMSKIVSCLVSLDEMAIFFKEEEEQKKIYNQQGGEADANIDYFLRFYERAYERAKEDE